jgi:hypothetical protein
MVPDQNGNNIILKMSFFDDDRLQEYLDLQVFSDLKITLLDNGLYPDVTSGDRIFSAIYKENISNFTLLIKSNIEANAAKGKLVYYNGNTGVEDYDLPTFDFVGFSALKEVVLHKKLTRNNVICNDLLKQKSLFITDLSVVEDMARTYNNKYELGNPVGCWTFGEMMKNIANESGGAGHKSAKELLKVWLDDWANKEIITLPASISGTYILEGRTNIFKHLINPWLERCVHENSGILTGVLDNDPLAPSAVTFTDYDKDANGQLVLDINGNPTFTSVIMQSHIKSTNWKTIWDNIPEAVLLKYAPFRLMAISNRIDMRSNELFEKRSFNYNYRGGETRFVFTLIRVTGTNAIVGEVPRHHDQDFTTGAQDNADWEGMNVILEYGNTSKSLCEEKALAQEWLNLSNISTYPIFPLPAITATNYTTEFNKSQLYNAALQLITDKVTKVGADFRRKNNNYSAINQIRTNEKIFHNPESDGTIFGTNDARWSATNWELRQFEINPSSHLLKRVDVLNVPATENMSKTSFVATQTNAWNIVANPGSTIVKYNNNDYDLFDWATKYNTTLNTINFGRVASVLTQTHRLVNTATYNIYTAPTANLFDERFTYFDFWASPLVGQDALREAKVTNLKTIFANVVPSKISSGQYTTDADVAKYIRHGLSIQTCQGCHSGDTKTMFTMIHPQGYGKTAIYWNGTPDVITKSADNRFERNIGATTNFIGANYDINNSTNIPVV